VKKTSFFYSWFKSIKRNLS